MFPYNNRMTVGVFVLTVIVGICGYLVYQKYLDIVATNAADNAQAAQIQSNISRTGNALVTAGVSMLQVNNGFWYIYTDRYGSESVAHFNPQTWSFQGPVSDAQIADLAKTVASSTIVDNNAMYRVTDNQLPVALQFHNMLYNNPIATPGTYQNTQSALETAYQNGRATSPALGTRVHV